MHKKDRLWKEESRKKNLKKSDGQPILPISTHVQEERMSALETLFFDADLLRENKEEEGDKGKMNLNNYKIF